MANKARKRGDGARDWPVELIYTHLLDRFLRSAPRGVVRVGRGYYTSETLKQYADEWEAARRPGGDTAPVEVFAFSETKRYLLWKHPDGNLRLLEATQQTAANVGDATDWLHSFINQLKQAELRVQRIRNTAADVLPRQKEKVMAPVEQAPGYSSNDTYQSAVQPAPRPIAVETKAGEVVAVNTVQETEPTTVLGAAYRVVVAGGLLGNQVGGGSGRVLATIAGAFGGGLAGNGIEHAVRKATSYRAQVRIRDGSCRNFNYSTQSPVQIGERVHVSGDSLAVS